MFSAKKLRLPVLALMMALLTLSSCGWFGGGTRSAPEVDDATANPLMPDASGGGLNFGRPEAPDPSVRIATVDSLTVERTPTGAIVVATGTATLAQAPPHHNHGMLQALLGWYSSNAPTLDRRLSCLGARRCTA